MKAEYIDHMGSDLSVVNAARVSFGKEKTEMDEADHKLIAYLAKHNHWTPFAHTSISLRMQAPVPIRTQMFKHKFGLVENEESRRYISSRPELFIPDHFRMKPVGSIKQGSEGVHPKNGRWIDYYRDVCEDMICIYEEMLSAGICPEQARFVLPQGVEVNWVWTGSLAAFARVYKQRKDQHAQQESRDLVGQIASIIAPRFPVSWEALTT